MPKGGALCALPALLANGLLHGAESLLGQVNGYYRTLHIRLLLAFMALCRIKTVEKLRGHPPGEFGKLLGLDRVPEVRCLREKLDQLSQGDAAGQWSAHLSRQWMQADWVQKKADLFEEIQHLEHDFLAIKAKVKATAHYITWEKLENDDSF